MIFSMSILCQCGLVCRLCVFWCVCVWACYHLIFSCVCVRACVRACVCFSLSVFILVFYHVTEHCVFFLLPPHHSPLLLPHTDDSAGWQMIHNGHTRGWGVETAIMNLRALTVSLVLVNSNSWKDIHFEPNHHPLLSLINIMGYIPQDSADYFTL